MRFCEGLLGLPRADDVVEDPGEVLFDPPDASVELTTLPGGHNDETEAQLLQFSEAFKSTGNGGRFVETIRQVEFLDLPKGLLWCAPARVLFDVRLEGHKQNEVCTFQ